MALGLKPHGIHVITREEGSGTRTAFEELVMKKAEITQQALVQDSNGAVREIVANDPNAIGFISCGLVNQPGKGSGHRRRQPHRCEYQKKYL